MKAIFTDKPKKILMLGCGSVGRAMLPVLIEKCALAPESISIITADPRGQEAAQRYGIAFKVAPLTTDNYLRVLRAELTPGDFLLNLSVDISSIDLIQYCLENNVFYLDTCIEPWPGFYTNPELSPSERSNYALREKAQILKRESQGRSTALVAQGANPGLVSQFVKQALCNMAKDVGFAFTRPSTRIEWAQLAQKLGIKAIHIAERDTQTSPIPRAPGEFVNTWSIDGFLSEGYQPAELGWGSHEKTFPAQGQRHAFGCDSAIYLQRPGAGTKVRTWTPLAGAFHGFLVTHNESISIADYFTVRGADEQLLYRPTVHYAYHPCDAAVVSMHEMLGKDWLVTPKQRLICEEITHGQDELGVLLLGGSKGPYWFGSQLSIEEARKIAPYNSATSLQVVAGILGGMAWILANPRRGVVEADDLDFDQVLEVATPFLGPVVGIYGDWNPLENRGRLFPEASDPSDPWQFSNILVP